MTPGLLVWARAKLPGTTHWVQTRAEVRTHRWGKRRRVRLNIHGMKIELRHAQALHLANMLVDATEADHPPSRSNHHEAPLHGGASSMKEEP